jgi:hypothetical protein
MDNDYVTKREARATAQPRKTDKKLNLDNFM